MRVTGVVGKLLDSAKSLCSNIVSSVKSFFGTPNKKRTALELGLHREKLQEKCGLFGIYNVHRENIAREFVLPMNRLQHRGQDATGIVLSDTKTIQRRHGENKGIGMVAEVFPDELMEKLNGNLGIGHTLYTTSRSQNANDIHVQPIIVGKGVHKIALAHNGNIPDTSKLKEFLSGAGYSDAKLSRLNDSKLIAHAIQYLFENENIALEDAVEKVIGPKNKLIQGGFCLLVISKDKLVACRDPYGFRPLSYTTNARKGSIAFASETSALKPLEPETVESLEPGEMVTVDSAGDFKKKRYAKAKTKLDAFEFVYFSRPDSVIDGISVNEVRRRSGITLGKKLEKLGIEADCVMSVPESGNPAAYGVAEALGLPIRLGLIKNRHRRTFLEEGQGLDRKFATVDESIKGKRIILVDDSVVRGNTAPEIIKFFKKAKPKEIHFVVAAPPVFYPDFYGIDIKKQANLIAYKNREFKYNGRGDTEVELDIKATIKKIEKQLGVDSLTYMTIAELKRAIDPGGKLKDKLNLAVFDGDYPASIGANNRRAVEFLHSRASSRAAPA